MLEFIRYLPQILYSRFSGVNVPESEIEFTGCNWGHIETKD